MNDRLKDIRIQAIILFFVMVTIYINLIIWDFYFTSDTMHYGMLLKNWFEGNGMTNEQLFHPAHPLIMPIAIIFNQMTIPLIGTNYLLNYAIMDAILGALAVSLFYLVCYMFIPNRKFGLICALGLAFSFTFWENCEMAEDRSLAWVVLIIYVPIVFSYMGEIHPFKRFEKLKLWQKGLVTGIVLGCMIAVHFTFMLIFIFTLVIGWRYRGLRYFKSKDFLWFLIGCILVSAIVYVSVAMVFGIDSIGGFINMFTGYHQGGKGEQFFALSQPQTFSPIIALRGASGGIFTSFFMYASSNLLYRIILITICGFMLLVSAFVFINNRKNKVIDSFFFLYAIWFTHYIFFMPSERNSWAFLLVPFWLSMCISMDLVPKNGLHLILLKRKLPKRITQSFWKFVTIFVVILLVNNIIVFGDAHLNRDNKEIFAKFVDGKIDKNSILITDNPTGLFFRYYTEIEVVSFSSVVSDTTITEYINNSYSNNRTIYVTQFLLLDTYIIEGYGRSKQRYGQRLERHKILIDRFNNMYETEFVFEHSWSDIYRISVLK